MSRYSDPQRIYIARSLLNRDAVKIGVSTNPELRMSALCAELVAVLDVPKTRDAYQIERNLHRWFEEDRIVGEWFSRGAIKQYLWDFFDCGCPGHGLDYFRFLKDLYEDDEAVHLRHFDFPRDDL